MVDASVFTTVLSIMVAVVGGLFGYTHHRINRLEEAQDDRMNEVDRRITAHELATERLLGQMVTRNDLRQMFEDYKRDQRERHDQLIQVIHSTGYSAHNHKMQQ